ncbi:MAG: hypothetical protein F6K10_36275 [Moorea sp. SIO2B7]|nr:hypothetical protein [Moorena sp. SIO2B7]
MKPQTEEIVAALEELTEDLYYSLVGDEPYVIFTWEIEEKGSFSLENFLLAQKALTPFESEDFISEISQSQSQSVKEHYQNLITLLQANLSELKIYGYGFPELPSDLFNGDLPIEEDELETLGIPIIIGLLPEGEWIGLAPGQNGKYNSSPSCILANLESVSENTSALLEQIKSITSKIDHKMKSSDWGNINIWRVVITSTPNEVIEKLLSNTEFLHITEIEQFFSNIENQMEELDEDEEIPTDLEKTIQLKDYFQSELRNYKVYNLDYMITRESFTIHYVLGQTQDGDWMGLVTDSFTF